MKVKDLIIHLLAMPMTADVELDMGEEYRAFSVDHRTAGEAGQPPLVALVPDPDPAHLSEITAKYARMEAAAPDMLAALKGVSRSAALSEAWLAPVLAAIAKAEGTNA